jgi:hypothetical protein
MRAAARPPFLNSGKIVRNQSLCEKGLEISSLCTENALTAPGFDGKVRLEMYTAVQCAPTGTQFQRHTIKRSVIDEGSIP